MEVDGVLTDVRGRFTRLDWAVAINGKPLLKSLGIKFLVLPSSSRAGIRFGDGRLEGFSTVRSKTKERRV